MADLDRQADIPALETFIQSAPPGELGIVTSDIQNILTGELDLTTRLAPAFKRYHEAQFAVARLPGGKGETAIISEHNRLDEERYFDVHTGSSFVFDPISKAVTEVEPFELESDHADLVHALYAPIKAIADNHHTSNSVAIFPADDKIAIIIVSNQYNSRNFWNGRWRSRYLFDPTSGALSGSIKLDIHYFEDGNVRFNTNKQVEDDGLDPSATAGQIAQVVLAQEEAYHQTLNKTFLSMPTGPLKDLRPKLPVTKQKIDWDKIAMSKISHDLADLTFKSS